MATILSSAGPARRIACLRNAHRKVAAGSAMLSNCIAGHFPALPYPNLFPPSEEMQSLTAFADEMRVMIERLTSGGKRHHVRWPLVKQAARKCPKANWTALAI